MQFQGQIKMKSELEIRLQLMIIFSVNDFSQLID